MNAHLEKHRTINVDMFSIAELSERIVTAEKRIRPHILKTRLLRFPGNSGHLLLKLENEQHTGSFKARGSLNKVMSLSPDQRAHGVITASTGNHGLGVCRALQLTDTEGTIYLPRSAKRAKVEKLQTYGVSLKFVDGGPLKSELEAKAAAAKTGAVWISPYNDIDVIAGQGTIGIELLEQTPGIKRVFITVGGGGLISGVATYLKSQNPEIQIIGCVPENSPEMMLSVQTGKIVHLEDAKSTLSDGSAGGAEDGSITFDYCRSLVDSWIAVTEKEIAGAMRQLYTKAALRAEGSAGVAFAAHSKSGHAQDGDVVIICGGNIEDEDFFDAIG